MRTLVRVVVYVLAFLALPLGVGYFGLRSALATYLAPTPIQPVGRDFPTPPELDSQKPTVAVVLGNQGSDPSPDRANRLESRRHLADSLQPGRLVVFFFACHMRLTPNVKSQIDHTAKAIIGSGLSKALTRGTLPARARQPELDTTAAPIRDRREQRHSSANGFRARVRTSTAVPARAG